MSRYTDTGYRYDYRVSVRKAVTVKLADILGKGSGQKLPKGSSSLYCFYLEIGLTISLPLGSADLVKSSLLFLGNPADV